MSEYLDDMIVYSPNAPKGTFKMVLQLRFKDVSLHFPLKKNSLTGTIGNLDEALGEQRPTQ